MKKRMKKAVVGRMIFFGFLFVALLTLGRSSKGSVLGDKVDKNKESSAVDRSKNENKGETERNKTTDVDNQPIVTVTVLPTKSVTTTVEKKENKDTNEVDVPVGGETSVLQDNSTNNTEKKSYTNLSQGNETTKASKEIIVSVTERSTTNETVLNKPLVKPTINILKTIGDKVKNVGSGEFLSKTTKTVVNEEKTGVSLSSSQVVGLGPDSRIFYSLLGDSNVLLGAVDKNDKRINVDEVELRGAELTMDKVLKDKGLSLGVSSDEELVLVDGDVKAYFSSPVFVDVFSHKISMEVSGSKKVIEIVPTQAVRLVLQEMKLNSSDLDKKIKMVVKNGDLYYSLLAKKTVWVLGKYPIKIDNRMLVNVETGEVFYGDDSLINVLLKSVSK